MNDSYKDHINQAYAAFNTRNMDAVLMFMHPYIHWPNGWEGGYVIGHNGIKDYWTRQWKELNPRVVPVAFMEKRMERWKFRCTTYKRPERKCSV